MSTARRCRTIKDTRAGKINADGAKTKFRGILNSAFDVNTIARFTLGSNWRGCHPCRTGRIYPRLPEKVILDKYADRLLEFSVTATLVDGARNIQ
jgi:ABC-type transporter MlaC component